MKTKNTNFQPEILSRSAQLDKNRGQRPKNQTEQRQDIYFEGPHCQWNRHGKEKPQWLVYLGYDQDTPVRTVYHVNDFHRAESLARVMSHDRNLELIAAAQPA